MRKHLLLLVIGVSLSVTGLAQQEAIDKYLNTAGDNAFIYNGELEDIYGSSIYLNRPYLDSDEYFPGKIEYDHRTYGNLKLRFNLFKEQLVVLSPQYRIGMNLDMRKISEFTIGSRTFVSCKEMPVGIPEEGFMQLLFNGQQVKLLVKKKCIFKASEVHNNISYSSFRFKDKYYVWANGTYHSISSKSLLYKLFPQYKKSLKHFVKGQYLNFRENYEYSLYLLVEHLQLLITQATKE